MHVDLIWIFAGFWHEKQETHGDSSPQFISWPKNGKTVKQAKMKQKDFPAHHVTFLKVHKAASTSVQNIFYRYGYRYNLTFAQPKLGSGLGPTTLVTPDKFYPPPPGQTRFDIMCVHSSYNRTIFEKLVSNDSIYIAIVRQPFRQFASSIVYFNKKEVLSIPGTNPVRTLLSEKLYKSRLMLPSYRYVNGQSRDFGYPVKLLMSKYDKNKFQNFLQQLNTELDLVMLVERFDESMILLRRLLKWEMKDVISGKLNGRDVPSRFQFGATEENLYKEISKYDYALYDFFKKKFQAKIDQQPTDFHDELIYFIQTKEKYNKFCLSMESLQYKVFRVLSFAESPWNSSFNVTTNDCEQLYMDEKMFSKLIKTKMGFIS